MADEKYRFKARTFEAFQTAKILPAGVAIATDVGLETRIKHFSPPLVVPPVDGDWVIKRTTGNLIASNQFFRLFFDLVGPDD